MPLYLYLLLVFFVALQRILELRISKKNELRLQERGGREIASKHFVFMRLLHTLWLFACWGEAWWREKPIHLALIIASCVVFAIGQILRLSAIATLQDRWTVCIFIVPNESPVTGGIYRYIRHPNYLGVVLEIASLPLIFGAWITALAFTIANGILLFIRIRAEEKALEEVGGYREAFAAHRRFIPITKKT